MFVTASPLSVIVGGFAVESNGLDGDATPEATGTVVGPIPARYTTTYSPGMAGEASVIKPKVAACCAIAYPDAYSAIPGDTVPDWIVCGVVSAPLAFTITSYGWPAVSSNGTCALICPALTKYSGAAMPPMITEVSPKLVIKGIVLPTIVCAARPDP